MMAAGGVLTQQTYAGANGCALQNIAVHTRNEEIKIMTDKPNEAAARPPYWIHETSRAGKTAKIGKGTRIWQFCNILDGAQIGDGCSLGQNVFIENGVKIGNHVKIKNNISIYSGVECGDDVFIGPNVVFTNVLNPRSFIEKKHEFKITILEQGCTLGANATIICGSRIGRYAMVGAGSVVIRDVPDYGLVVGNPSRLIGYVCKCGERLGSSGMECRKCHKTYIQTEEGIRERK